MSNSTLDTLRAMLRRKLNEPSAASSFWTDADLNAHLQEAYETYYRRYLDKMMEQRDDSSTVSYTGGQSRVQITSPTNLFRIIAAQDITQPANPRPLEPAGSLEEIIRLQAEHALEGGIYAGYPSHFFVDTEIDISGGVHSVDRYLWLAPVPSGTRSIEIFPQLEPQDLTAGASTYTTGLPDFVELCVVEDAKVKARDQEGSPLKASAEQDRARAEREMMRATRPHKTAGEVVIYRDEWVE